MQTDSEGLIRVIVQTDTQAESLVWVEKKFIEEEEAEERGYVAETESREEHLKDDRQENPSKRRKVGTHTSPSLLSCSNVNICRSAIQVKLSIYPRINLLS